MQSAWKAGRPSSTGLFTKDLSGVCIGGSTSPRSLWWQDYLRLELKSTHSTRFSHDWPISKTTTRCSFSRLVNGRCVREHMSLYLGPYGRSLPIELTCGRGLHDSFVQNLEYCLGSMYSSIWTQLARQTQPVDSNHDSSIRTLVLSESAPRRYTTPHSSPTSDPRSHHHILDPSLLYTLPYVHATHQFLEY